MDSISPAKSLVERTYDAILDAICSGEILPGERLNQDEIAARLNVSRQPVNSAISILKANGFVSDTGRRGSVVTELAPAKLHEVYEFRMVIEPFAVGLAADRLPREANAEAKRILRLGQKALQNSDVQSLVQADADFHRLIYKWSGNHVIETSMHVNWHHIRRAMAGVLKQRDLAELSWNAHEVIMNALLSGNTKDAKEAMEEHIREAKNRALSAVE